MHHHPSLTQKSSLPEYRKKERERKRERGIQGQEKKVLSRCIQQKSPQTRVLQEVKHVYNTKCSILQRLYVYAPQTEAAG